MYIPRYKSAAGFTLIELVVVMVIVGILVALGGQLIVAPISGYVDLARRTRLVDQAELALRRMQRDVRQALPNSIRIAGGGQYLELLHTTDGGRYRRYQGVPADDILDFSAADTGFDVLGALRAVPNPGQDLVVYNFSSAGSSGNAYDGLSQNRTSIAGTSTVNHIDLSVPFLFANASPYQRFFLLDGPVTFACEGGNLNRYDGYGISSAQQTPPVGIAPDLMTRGITSCQFSYNPGVGQRAGLMTLQLTLNEAGETITLLHQIHVLNAP